MNRYGSLSSFHRLIASCTAALFILAHPMVARAQNTPPTAQTATSTQVAQFLADPSSILNSTNLASTIQSLALANTDTNSTLATLIALSQNLNSQLSSSSNTADQIAAIQAELAAIGTGLADAATQVQTSNPKLASDIQSAVTASGVPATVTAYNTETGGSQTTSTGGGGGSGSGGATTGGAPGGGGSSGSGGTTFSGGTSSSGQGLTGGGTTTGSGGTTTTTSASVSPH